MEIEKYQNIQKSMIIFCIKPVLLKDYVKFINKMNSVDKHQQSQLCD